MTPPPDFETQSPDASPLAAGDPVPELIGRAAAPSPDATPAAHPPPQGFATFVRLWATQSLSLIGSGLTFFAVNIWLTQVLFPRPDQARQLAFALSANGLAFALPTVFLAPIAGAFADRHDRRRIMLVTDLVNAGLGVILAALLAAPRTGLWPVLLMMVAYCAAAIFHGAAFDSSLVMIVPKAQLPRANAMMQSMLALSGLSAPALAAALIALPELARHHAIGGSAGAWLAGFPHGVPFAILVDAVTFLVAGLALFAIPFASPRRQDKRPSLWADVVAGGRYIAHRTPLLWLLGSGAAVNLFFGPITVLVPLIVKFGLAADWQHRGLTYPSALAILLTVNSVGALSGAVVLSAWGGFKRHRVYALLGALVLAGGAVMGFRLARNMVWAGAALFLAGAALPLANVHGQAIWQALVPPELQGRVFSVRRLLAQCTYPLGTAMGGTIAGFIAPGLATALLGAAAAGFGLVQCANPAMRHVEDKEYLDALAARRAGGEPAVPQRRAAD